MRGLTGQLVVSAEGGKQYSVAFVQGAIVGAASPLVNDAALRIALTANLVSSSQLGDVSRRLAAADGRDEIDIIVEQTRLSPEHTMRLRRRVIAQRAARTFAVERGTFVVDDQITLSVVDGSELDVRAIVYLGVRNNLGEERLASEVDQMGSWFKLKPEALADLGQYGFSDLEKPVLERLVDGANVADLVGDPGLDPRTTRTILYSLASCSACELDVNPRASTRSQSPSSSPVVPRTPTPNSGGVAAARTPTPNSGGVPAASRTPTPKSGSFSVSRTPTNNSGSFAVPQPGGSGSFAAAKPGTGSYAAVQPGRTGSYSVVDPERATSSSSAPPNRSASASTAPANRPGSASTAPANRPGSASTAPASRTGSHSIPAGPRSGSYSVPQPSRTDTRPGSGSAPPPTASRPTRARNSTAAVSETERLIDEMVPLLDRGADHFAILGVPSEAAADVVRSAYFNLARKLHPDRLAALGIHDPARNAQRLFAQINAAFGVLTDPARRTEYISAMRRGSAASIAQEDDKASEMASRVMRAEEAFRQGEMAMRREQLQQAIASFALAVELQPHEPEYGALLAWAKFTAATDKASVAGATRTQLQKAADDAPMSPTGHFYLGRVERMLGREKQALAHFQEVLMIKPGHSEASSEIRILEQRLRGRR
jgi:DnaJ-domain-containing protein 1